MKKKRESNNRKNALDVWSCWFPVTILTMCDRTCTHVFTIKIRAPPKENNLFPFCFPLLLFFFLCRVINWLMISTEKINRLQKTDYDMECFFFLFAFAAGARELSYLRLTFFFSGRIINRCQASNLISLIRARRPIFWHHPQRFLADLSKV